MTNQDDTSISDEPAWGKLNQGQSYGIIAVDLDRALARAGLNKAEATLMQHIRDRSWGTSARRKRRGEPWPDARPCVINKAKLARRIDPRNAENVRRMIDRAEKALRRDRLIIATPAGTTINKEVHQWKRLTAADIRYATRAQRWRRKRYQSVADQSLPNGSGENATNRTRGPLPNGSGDRYQTVADPLKERAPRLLPYGSRDTPNGVRDTPQLLSPEEEAEADRETAAYLEWLARQRQGETNGTDNGRGDVVQPVVDRA